MRIDDDCDYHKVKSGSREGTALWSGILFMGLCLSVGSHALATVVEEPDFYQGGEESLDPVPGPYEEPAPVQPVVEEPWIPEQAYPASSVSPSSPDSLFSQGPTPRLASTPSAPLEKGFTGKLRADWYEYLKAGWYPEEKK